MDILPREEYLAERARHEKVDKAAMACAEQIYRLPFDSPPPEIEKLAEELKADPEYFKERVFLCLDLLQRDGHAP